ncbi:hypothetical protein GRF59_02645 [Paenibacillus sp. HJL G12]|uniref:Epoxide hydrolase N-terminal domain-containing protein n=1 Tax=Paenibacillus dendrobii TaxID=2691084 RepID=A0A7X3LEZ8_9BACL|nr:epoxide hydrolase N-terminal domain-containing protein [Paenibacillus dendrobii]MWV42517.1 hypothetical protein [Paenibacillus dendrobii]
MSEIEQDLESIASNDNVDIKPFRIHILEQSIDDLHERLAHTRWPDELDGVDLNSGVSVDYLAELGEYWQIGCDWRKYEEALNRFLQYTTTIDGQQIHFLHVRSPEQGAMPLILTHGWLGSIIEFINIIGPLTDPKARFKASGYAVIQATRPKRKGV